MILMGVKREGKKVLERGEGTLANIKGNFVSVRVCKGNLRGLLVEAEANKRAWNKTKSNFVGHIKGSLNLLEGVNHNS